MTDMNIDWARELLREAAGIYLAHLYEGGDMDELADIRAEAVQAIAMWCRFLVEMV